MYRSNISDRDWIIFDILGNVGWIFYYIGMGLTVRKGFPFEMTANGVFSYMELAAAVGILVGLVELISERIQKLDRVLPKVRLYRGFGTLTVAGFVGGGCAAYQGTVQTQTAAITLMAIGGLLCFLFSLLLFCNYKKETL